MSQLPGFKKCNRHAHRRRRDPRAAGSSSGGKPPMAVRNVWLFVPNLIGYARFLFLLWSLYHVLRAESTHLFLALYAASYLLDAADGPAARSLQQTSRFGAVLDMVTDRVSTAVLLAALAHESVASPSRALRPWAPAWLGLLVLDIAAHWVQMYATLALGAASHKALPDEPALLTWYYRRTNLFVVCLLSETHLVTAFTLSRGAAGVAVAGIPLCVGVGALARAHAFAAKACPTLTPPQPHTLANSFGFPLPRLPLPAALSALSPLLSAANLSLLAGWLYALSFPVFVLKQVISVMHLVRAAQRVVELDQADEAEAQKKAPPSSSRSAARKAK